MAAFPERKWLFGAEGLQRADRGALITTAGQVEPTGQMEVHDGGARVKTEVTKEKKRQFLDAKAWEIAISPGKQFMMTGERRTSPRAAGGFLWRRQRCFSLPLRARARWVACGSRWLWLTRGARAQLSCCG